MSAGIHFLGAGAKGQFVILKEKRHDQPLSIKRIPASGKERLCEA